MLGFMEVMPTAGKRDVRKEGRVVVIEKFEKALHDRSTFSCGNSTIGNYFKKPSRGR